MFARAVCALLAVALVACAPVMVAQDTRPQAAAAALLDQCRDRDGWSDPAPPAQIFANVYQIGTCGIVVLLVTSPAGHIVIDGAPTDAPASIARNIENLGFDLSDVRFILNSHEHFDHAGGIAELQRLTGAVLVARREAKAALETGLPDPSDPQSDHLMPFPGARVGQLIVDGEALSLGPLRLTAHATPGHSPGSTSWSWRSCDGAECHSIMYADSLSSISADSYRFSEHPDYVATFRASLDAIAAFDCDLLVTPHPAASNLYDRLAGGSALIDREACVDYAAGARRRLDTRLSDEAAPAG